MPTFSSLCFHLHAGLLFNGVTQVTSLSCSSPDIFTTSVGATKSVQFQSICNFDDNTATAEPDYVIRVEAQSLDLLITVDLESAGFDTKFFVFTECPAKPGSDSQVGPVRSTDANAAFEI